MQIQNISIKMEIKVRSFGWAWSKNMSWIKQTFYYFLGMGLDVALYDPRGAPKTFEDGAKHQQ